MTPGEHEVLASLRRLGLVKEGEQPRFQPLTGGVSSDIWRVDLERGPICIKRALSKLRVEADWQAPVERNAYEVAWMEAVAGIAPDAVPEVLGHDPDAGFFAMAYIDPVEHPTWKDELRDGRAEPVFAARVGECLGRIHAGTAGDPDVAARFASDDIFFAIRLEPYLEATAQAHPEFAPMLRAVIDETAGTKRALVHGDVSPKNILVGRHGPIFLDAECAWYGDPAFDLAFCLNHLLLKCLWTPAARADFLACYRALVDAYLPLVDWEAAARLEARTARLLPGLFLARADGKSPAEYLTDDGRRRIRAAAAVWLRDPFDRLSEIQAAWNRELSK